jgi:hypothetical protein
MTVTKLPYGKPVKLLIKLQGFREGRTVLFEIWKETGGSPVRLTTANGVTKGGEGVGEWPFNFKERTVALEKTVSRPAQSEKYYYVAKIDDQQVKSEDIVFTHPLDIQLEDENRQSLDGAEYTITFSDGTKKQGVLKGGHVKFEDAPPGKFKLELKNYKFVF